MATAIVTGTASGIGEALADKLVARGDTVYLADLDTDGAARVAERLGSRAFARRLDVTDAAAVQALVDEVDAEHGLDLMVNNAGIAVGGAADELGLEHWNRCIDVNLRGVVHGAHAAYLKMKARGRGQILNTASLAGLVVSPLTGPYTATKHAVVALSLSLRAEAALHGVQVSVLCPGVIDTPIFAQANDRLPQTAVGTKARELFHDLAKLLQGGKFYPPERLAADALRGLETDAPVIVAPLGARVTWWLDRGAPIRLRDVISRIGLKGMKKKRGDLSLRPRSAHASRGVERGDGDACGLEGRAHAAGERDRTSRVAVHEHRVARHRYLGSADGGDGALGGQLHSAFDHEIGVAHERVGVATVDQSSVVVVVAVGEPDHRDRKPVFACHRGEHAFLADDDEFLVEREHGVEHTAGVGFVGHAEVAQLAVR